MKDLISIIDVKDHVGETVKSALGLLTNQVKGNFNFFNFAMEQHFFQTVVFKPNMIENFGEEEGTAKFDEIKHLSQETSVYVTGVVKEDSRSKFGYELDVTDLEVIGQSHDYQLRQKNTALNSSLITAIYGCVQNVKWQ